MAACPTHDFLKKPDHAFGYHPGRYPAIVDLESYAFYVGEETDYLDMIGHLCRQTEALTAVMWETPEIDLQLRLLLAGDHRIREGLEQGGQVSLFEGWVRTFGQLGLAGHEWLLECARHRDHSFLQGKKRPENRRAQVLTVPPGVYAVSVFSQRPGREVDREAADYTIVLRHYPHPAPRLMPVRLGSLIPWAESDPAAAARPFGL